MNRPTVFVVLALMGCTPEPVPGVTETGNPEFSAGVAMRARSSDPSSISVRGDGDVDINSMWMAVEAVQLLERTDCDGDGQPSFVDRFVSDATTAEPDVQRGQVQESVYCGALIRLEPTASPDAGPADLPGNTLVLTGISEEQRPFVIRSSLVFDIPLSRDEGNFYLSQTNDRIDIGIDVSVWMDEIWVDDATPDATGSIVIDDTSNTTLLREFEAGLLDAMDLELVDD